MSKSHLTAVAVALALLGACRPAWAQRFGMGGTVPAENIEGFTVAGKGTVAARPNLIEIDLEVSSASELTADAIVKYRDARRRLLDAFAALKLDNVTVGERGLKVDQKGQMPNYYFSMAPSNRAKTEVQLSRKLVVRAANLRSLDEDALLQMVAKLIDVAQDAGAKVGAGNDRSPYYYYYYDEMPPASGLVRFVVEDLDKLQEEAYEKAIADARARAQRLARLSGVELGPIVAVREVSVAGEKATSAADDEMPKKRLEIGKFQEIPVRVELMVRFQIQSNTGGRGRTGGQ